jgi:hypothetical protein
LCPEAGNEKVSRKLLIAVGEAAPGQFAGEGFIVVSRCFYY